MRHERTENDERTLSLQRAPSSAGGDHRRRVARGAVHRSRDRAGVLGQRGRNRPCAGAGPLRRARDPHRLGTGRSLVRPGSVRLRRAVQHREPQGPACLGSGPGGDLGELPRWAAARLRGPQRADLGAARRAVRARGDVAPHDHRSGRWRRDRSRALRDRSRRDGVLPQRTVLRGSARQLPQGARRGGERTPRRVAAARCAASGVQAVPAPGGGHRPTNGRGPDGTHDPGARARSRGLQQHGFGPPRGRRRPPRRRRRARVAGSRSGDRHDHGGRRRPPSDVCRRGCRVRPYRAPERSRGVAGRGPRSARSVTWRFAGRARRRPRLGIARAGSRAGASRGPLAARAVRRPHDDSRPPGQVDRPGVCHRANDPVDSG